MEDKFSNTNAEKHFLHFSNRRGTYDLPKRLPHLNLLICLAPTSLMKGRGFCCENSKCLTKKAEQCPETWIKVSESTLWAENEHLPNSNCSSLLRCRKTPLNTEMSTTCVDNTS